MMLKNTRGLMVISFLLSNIIFIPKQMADSNPTVTVKFGIDRSDHGAVQALLSFDLDKGREVSLNPT
jgi:hypothetical protein